MRARTTSGYGLKVRAPLVGRGALRQRRDHGVVRLGVQAGQRFAHHSHARAKPEGFMLSRYCSAAVAPIDARLPATIF